jgi:aspartate aminotransferase
MMVLVEPGDEIILIAPYWATYREQILLAGGVPVVVQVDSTTHFLPSVEQIKEKITPRTKAILLNTPNNPTGAVYPRSLLKEIAAVCLRYGLWVIVDEIYERLVYEGEHVSIAALGHEIAEQTVTISGCSKTYAMTGWRIGFSVSPPCVAKAIANLQDQVTSNATSFAQIGALKALELPEGVVGEMRREYRVRRGLILEMLRDIEGLSVPTPHGAFYVMPYVGKYLHDGVTDSRLAEAILEKVNVAVVPGSVFYGEGYLRLSYAASQEDIRKGMERLAYFFKEIDHMIK